MPAVLGHGLRMLVLVGLIATLRYAQLQRQAAEQTGRPAALQLDSETLRAWFGPQTRLVADATDPTSRRVEDSSATPVGSIIATYPQSLQVRGYRGPSHLLVGLDRRQRIVGVQLQASEDTPDHVAAIERSAAFFEQFSGRDADSIATSIDVVSGATLTSLAIHDAVTRRLGGSLPQSTRFPQPLKLAEARRWFPEAETLKPLSGQDGMAEILGSGGRRLGTLARTGPLDDHINGYQGPTDVLLGFDETGSLIHAKVRSSFDNQPYVSYLDDEPWFLDPLFGKDWSQLAESDARALQIEGVSGATMTSMAVADTIIAAAQVRQSDQDRSRTGRAPAPIFARFSGKQAATLGIIFGAFLLPRMKFFKRPGGRAIWHVIVVVGLGFYTGNLLSLALLMGWGAGGIAWKLAPGLALLLAATVFAALARKQPLYCAHLCPHGALQQQTRHWLPARWQLRVPARYAHWLQRLPAAALACAYVLTLIGWDVNLATWEAFDAYLLRLGAAASFVIAIATLLLSMWLPMGYCRFACPTGTVLSYIRLHRKSNRFGPGDGLAIGLLVGAWIWLAVR